VTLRTLRKPDKHPRKKPKVPCSRCGQEIANPRVMSRPDAVCFDCKQKKAKESNLRARERRAALKAAPPSVPEGQRPTS
jgi:RNA polymerase-binding transcription factor DksA